MTIAPLVPSQKMHDVFRGALKMEVASSVRRCLRSSESTADPNKADTGRERTIMGFHPGLSPSNSDTFALPDK